MIKYKVEKIFGCTMYDNTELSKDRRVKWQSSQLQNVP